MHLCIRKTTIKSKALKLTKRIVIYYCAKL